MKKEYAVGIKIINMFYVEAESRDEAEQIVREYDPYKTLDDCDFSIEYADPTNGEIAWKIKSNEVDWKKIDPKNFDRKYE
jgi:predicted metal-dependent TIM-barrel fold hydrolase